MLRWGDDANMLLPSSPFDLLMGVSVKRISPYPDFSTDQDMLIHQYLGYVSMSHNIRTIIDNSLALL